MEIFTELVANPSLADQEQERIEERLRLIEKKRQLHELKKEKFNSQCLPLSDNLSISSSSEKASHEKQVCKRNLRMTTEILRCIKRQEPRRAKKRRNLYQILQDKNLDKEIKRTVKATTETRTSSVCIAEERAIQGFGRRNLFESAVFGIKGNKQKERLEEIRKELRRMTSGEKRVQNIKVWITFNDGTQTRAIVNTGAESSSITTRWIDCLRKNGISITIKEMDSPIEIKSVGGVEVARITETSQITFRIANACVRVEMLVIKSDIAEVIIGMDVLHQYIQTIDIDAKQIIVNNKWLMENSVGTEINQELVEPATSVHQEMVTNSTDQSWADKGEESMEQLEKEKLELLAELDKLRTENRAKRKKLLMRDVQELKRQVEKAQVETDELKKKLQESTGIGERYVQKDTRGINRVEIAQMECLITQPTILHEDNNEGNDGQSSMIDDESRNLKEKMKIIETRKIVIPLQRCDAEAKRIRQNLLRRLLRAQMREDEERTVQASKRNSRLRIKIPGLPNKSSTFAKRPAKSRLLVKSVPLQYRSASTKKDRKPGISSKSK